MGILLLILGTFGHQAGIQCDALNNAVVCQSISWNEQVCLALNKIDPVKTPEATHSLTEILNELVSLMQRGHITDYGETLFLKDLQTLAKKSASMGKKLPVNDVVGLLVRYKDTLEKLAKRVNSELHARSKIKCLGLLKKCIELN